MGIILRDVIRSSPLAPNAKRRGSNVVVHGERRSANRTNWSQSQQDTLPSTRLTTSPEATFLEDGPPSLQETTVRGELHEKIWGTAELLQPQFFDVDRLVDVNSRRVREACRKERLGPHHFAGSSGYGHGDLGRAALDQVVARSFGAESALVRHHFVSGTHAIAAALFGVSRPGHELICVTGSPYDTLHDVIGHRRTTRSFGSLCDWGIVYKELELNSRGEIDLAALTEHLTPKKSQAVYLQRSCGYAMRRTLRINEIERVVAHVRQLHPDCLVLVDNCYGEFTEDQEPTHVGADLVMGSLIKNPGGTIVSTGGYIAGRQELMQLIHARLTAPGIGIDAGSVSGESLRLMFQGFCLAPQMVGEALKSGLLISHVLDTAGFAVSPEPSFDRPFCPITAVRLGSESKMVQFCRAIQRLCPVGSYVHPVPGKTPGYADAVVFADGTFVDGSTSELTADGPVRPPYVVYCQGGTHWTQWAEALQCILSELQESF